MVNREKYNFLIIKSSNDFKIKKSLHFLIKCVVAATLRVFRHILSTHSYSRSLYLVKSTFEDHKFL